PVPLRVMAPDVEIPLPLERLLARLLAKRPGERPRRVTDITPELSALAEGVYDSRTTRMPLMATTPGGLRQIVPPGEEGEDPRWGGPTMRVLEDPLAGRREMPPRTAPDAREDGSSTDGTGRLLGLDPGSVRGGEPAGPVPDPEARREGTEDYTKPGDGGDETPIYQPTVGSTPARRQEPWRNPDYIPMDGKDEWTTTSRHIPGMDVEEADPPPHAEWDAPSPAWESPPARKGAAIPRPQERSNRLLAVLVVLLISVTLLAGALHYQLLDGFMARFGLGRPVRLTGEPGPPRPAARPDRRGAEYTSEAVSTGAEDDAGSAAKDVSEPPAERVSGDAAAETAADVPFEAIEQARRQGLQAAGRGDFLEAIGHFERARELGGEPEDLDRLIDECRRKHQEQR
ncbi:MAG: hypothetical protein FJ098_15720, partial [Deltaproteobacteria bacterium]|nr:hypothetical protein [Deltaproteobacteria bacterium]